MTARGVCERCGVPVIGDRANPRVWAHCLCVGCLPPAPRLPVRPLPVRPLKDAAPAELPEVT